MMSRAGLRDWCPYATPVLLIAANVPDVDFVSILGDDLLILDWHRGPTHAFFFIGLMAVLPLAPLLLFARKTTRWLRAYIVSALGVLSHILLDLTNIFGVRFLEPFSPEYFHLDITGVTDLWMLALLMAASGWLLLSRLVSSEIGAQRSSGRGVAIAALLFVLCWQSGRYVMHERALAILDSRIYDGEVPTRVAALPHFGSPLHWTGIAETSSAYNVFEMNATSSRFDPTGGKTFYKPETSAAIETVRQLDSFQRFFSFSHYPLWLVMPDAESNGQRVQVMDLRFGHPGEERFLCTAIVAPDGTVGEHWFQFDPPGGGPRLR
jgi:inner membrane protein